MEILVRTGGGFSTAFAQELQKNALSAIGCRLEKRGVGFAAGDCVAGLFQKQYVQNLAVKLRAVVPTLRKARKDGAHVFVARQESKSKD